MPDSLCSGTIVDVPEPFTYRARLADGREVVVIPSRLHFEHTPDDLDRLRALQPGVAVTIRVSDRDPAAGWLVQVARTAKEWQTIKVPAALLETVRPAATARVLRRFAVTCCRRIEGLLEEGPHRALLGVLEAYADGRASADDLTAALAAGREEERLASDRAEEAEHDPLRGLELMAAAKAIWAVRIAARVVPDSEVFELALDAARACAEAVGLRARAGLPEEIAGPARAAAEQAERAAQADVVRQLFDNPFPSAK